MTWVQLRSSARARWLRRLAVALTACSALACLWAALNTPAVHRGAIAALAVAAAILASRAGHRDSGGALRVDSSGGITLRRHDAEAPASPLYCSGGYVALESAGLWPVWRDALPADHWRRLQVACRWPAGTGSGASPGDERTK